MSLGHLRLERAGDRLRLVQITDTHLYRAEGGTLLGLDTDFSLRHVIDLVRARQPRIDLVLATGDISDRGSEESYRRARDYLGQLGSPVLWLPGNHDRFRPMAEVLGEAGELRREARSDRWLVTMLHSQVPGEVGGRLGAAELAEFESRLEHARAHGLHCLVCLHHQPVPVGSAWIDPQMLEDSDAFWALVDANPCVKGVIWGHVHQQIDRRRGDVLLMSTPSTCVQFAPGSDEFRLDDAPPGYRWLDLFDDGRIESGVVRVADVEFDVDLESRGYL